MTVNTKKITSGPYAGNGVADTFSYTFKVSDNTQLSVFETNDQGFQTELLVDTDYTVNTIGDASGGTITRLAGALPVDYEWYVRSNYDETQLTSFSSQGSFFPDVHEDAMDKLTFLIQQILDEKGRSPSVPNSYSGDLPLTLDTPAAGKMLRWNSEEDGLENVLLSEIDPNIIFPDEITQNSTLASSIDDNGIVLGEVFSFSDRNNSTWDCVLTSTVTPTGDGVVQSNVTPALSFKLRNSDINSEESITDNTQTMNGFTDIEPNYMSELKELGDIASDNDSVTVKRKAIKAWKKPTGIKDSAVAGSFILNNGVNEPGTQVSGFPTIDDIGIQQSRDAVVVFGQVDSAPALLVTSNTTYTATTIVSPDFAAIWDEIEVGLICDVNFGTVGWVGAVITNKSGNDTLHIQSWREIDGVSGPATTPVNGLPLTIDRHNAIWGANFNAIIPAADSGANQAIGIEVGLQCSKAGTGTNSKGYFAVNLGGERPEFGYSMTGGFSKGYTSQDSNVYGFGSIGDKVGLDVMSPTDNAIQTQDPVGNHIECRDSLSASQFIVKNDGKLVLGKNAESGQARCNIRGAGDFATPYDETEFAIFDPTTALTDRQGFYISHILVGGSSAASVYLGVNNTSNHVYQLKVQTAGLDRMHFHSNGHIYAGADGTQTMGTAAARWSEVFAVNGTINTSDETLKTFGKDFTDAEKKVAIKLKSLLTNFKWNESIEREESEGKKARIHIGIGAQSLGRAFKAEGLDPNDYAMFCYDEWEEEKETVQTNRGETITVEKEIEQPVIETITVNKIVEDVKLIDGKYTLVKEAKDVEVDQPVYETHNVYNKEGDPVIDVVVSKDEDGNEHEVSTARVIAIPVMETITVSEEVPCEPVYEDVVRSAGNRYGVRLDQVLAFILANT